MKLFSFLLHEVGFEPTRPKPDDLKSPPLDHSGIRAYNTINFLRPTIIFITNKKRISQVMKTILHLLFVEYISSYPDSNRGLKNQNLQ